MQDRLLSNVRYSNFYRINTNIKLTEESIDKFIGRKAHIEFIDNHFLIKTLMFKFLKDISN